MDNQEKDIWTGSPSQIVNVPTYILCFIFSWLIIPLFIALYKFLSIKFYVYSLSSERLKITSGVLSKQTECLELYRVKDITLEQPFSLRLFGFGNIILHTSDKTTPTITIQAIKDLEELSNQIRRLVEDMRIKRKVREVDFE